MVYLHVLFLFIGLWVALLNEVKIRRDNPQDLKAAIIIYIGCVIVIVFAFLLVIQ